MSLTGTNAAAFAKRDPAKVLAAMVRLPFSTGKKQWVSPTNRYRLDPVTQLESDIGAKTVDTTQIAEYIAASAVLHSADGWTLFGRAIDATIDGSAANAVHLGYYAALRAAMSLLATQAVGVFGREHVILTRRGTLHTKAPTHEFAWDALEAWLTDPRTPEILAPLVVAYGNSLDDWLDAFTGGLRFDRIFSVWLRRIGLDVARLRADRVARNDASYRPDGVHPRRAIDVPTVANYVTDCWRIGLPGAAFEDLHRHWVRIALEEAGRLKGSYPGRAFGGDVAGAVHLLAEPLRSSAARFFVRLDQPADHITISAGARASAGRADEAVEVGSRAVALLTLSTITSADLLQSAVVDSKHMKFWWAALGGDRGLWVRAPSAVADLWSDVELALGELDKWRKRNRAVNPSRQVWQRDLQPSLNTLSSFDRLAIWALHP